MNGTLKVVLAIGAGLLLLALWSAYRTSVAASNYGAWRDCIQAVYASTEPGVGGDLDYHHCDAQYDPHQRFTYYK
jgi:hypothetical protein